jgi:quercetin dioxygenase-like cupin family protein
VLCRIAQNPPDVSKVVIIRCVHLKTGADGRSHVEYNTIPLGIVQQATAVHFEETPAGSALDWHTAPRVQYVITLSGTLEFTTRDGEQFVLRPVRYCWLPIQPARVIVGDSSMISPGGVFTFSCA